MLVSMHMHLGDVLVCVYLSVYCFAFTSDVYAGRCSCTKLLSKVDFSANKLHKRSLRMSVRLCVCTSKCQKKKRGRFSTTEHFQ